MENTRTTLKKCIKKKEELRVILLNMRANRIKIGIIISSLAPYRDVAVEQLISEKKGTQYDVEMLVLEKTAETHKEWKYKSPLERIAVFSKGETRKVPVFGGFHKDLYEHIKLANYDLIVISGYYPYTCLKTLKYCWKNKIPYILTGDTVEDGSYNNFIKKKLINKIYEQAEAFYVPGNLARSFLQNKNISSSLIFEGYYMNDHTQQYQQIYSENKSMLRENLGIKTDDVVFLFIGKLITTRRIQHLLTIANDLHEKYSKIKFLVIGDGPEENKVSDYNGGNIIHIKQVPYRDVHNFYHLADAYIHPGKEPYSLALVEAALAGIPIVSTDSVGAVYDILENGKNGFIIPFDNVEKLKQAVLNVYQKEYSDKSVKAMQKYLLEDRNGKWSKDQLEAAILKAMGDE